jgi:SAM-dependent methyltransferase
MSVSARFFFDVAYRMIDEMIGTTCERTIHVDIPVGTARFFSYLRDQGRLHRMFGFDLSPGMLRASREKMNERSEQLALTRSDAFHLPLADNSVDILTSMRFFHLMPRRYWAALLGEMHRVLRPGGFLIAEMRNPFRGGVVARAVECRDQWFRGAQPHAYVWPHRLSTLFADWDRIETRGAGLDGLAQVSTLLPGTARRLHGLARYTPFRYLTRELVVKAFKAPN